MKVRRINESAEFNFNSAASSGNWPYKMSIKTYVDIRDEISQIIDNLDQSCVFAIARDATNLGLNIDKERLYYSPIVTIENNISPEKINQFRSIVMKYSNEQLNEASNRKFYIDEIVSAQGGKTETERHSFATIDELKKYCKDAGLTKDDIANCGGCDVKDLCEGLEGSLHIQYCPSCGCQNDYSDSQDNGSWVRYTCRSCGNTWDIDKPQTNDAINEEVEKLHTKPNGEYLVKSDSGKGYTAFSRDNVAIGGIDNEDADSDDKAIDKFKRNEYSECLNEEYFDTAEYRIQKYEDNIPELMTGMHDDYMEGKLDAARYAEALKKVYDALSECDYKYTMSAPVVTNGSGKRVLDALDKLDEEVDAYNPLDKDDEDDKDDKDDKDFEYDDDYSNDYDESLEECSGIRAHKVIMGEDLDNSFDDNDGVEGPTGDKTEDIEFVMEEYVAESLLIDFVEKVDALTYKVGANDQIVTVVFDPKWSEYVYTIDGKGPYSHRSYEFISRDIYNFVMSQTGDSESDDVVD